MKCVRHVFGVYGTECERFYRRKFNWKSCHFCHKMQKWNFQIWIAEFFSRQFSIEVEKKENNETSILVNADGFFFFFIRLPFVAVAIQIAWSDLEIDPKKTIIFQSFRHICVFRVFGQKVLGRNVWCMIIVPYAAEWVPHMHVQPDQIIHLFLMDEFSFFFFWADTCVHNKLVFFFLFAKNKIRYFIRKWSITEFQLFCLIRTDLNPYRQ